MTQSVEIQSLSKLLDLSANQISGLLTLATKLKQEKQSGQETCRLTGKNIALIFEKASTRTRCAFEVAAYDQGAHVTYLGPDGSQIGVKETMKDTARVLGRMYDGIEYRGFSQERFELLVEFSGVPVWNGLTDEYHPTQVLADFLTIQEHSKQALNHSSLCYIGDAHNNMGDSLLVGAAKMGMDFRIAAPKALWPNQDLITQCQKIAAQSGARLMFTESVEKAVKQVDFLYTDVWVSMGESEQVWQLRIDKLLPYQINHSVLQQCGNPKVKVMHCLPAFHNRDTEVGEKIFQEFGISEMEITDDVFESPASIIFDQSENRMHTIKAVMVASYPY